MAFVLAPSSFKRALDFALRLLPALLGYLLWAEYAELNSIPKSFGLRPSEDWNFDVFDQILFATVVQFNGRPYAPVAAFLVVVLFLWVNFGVAPDFGS